MAVSGTVPARRTVGIDPMRYVKGIRRFTVLAAVLTFAWFFLRFGTQWVPRGMDTVPELPPESWCIVDRWASGLAVGSVVFYEGPLGLMVGRVSEVDGESFAVQNDNTMSRVPDSSSFGKLPRTALRGIVVGALQPSIGDRRGG